jgi:proteasome lid subunit RPN8/RPN11
VRLVAPLPLELFSKPQDKLARLANEIRDRGSHWEDRIIGIIAWPAQDHVCADYFAELPDRLSALLTWAKDLGLPLRRGVDEYVSRRLRFTGGRQEATLVPITLAIPRPRRLIGMEANIELLDFVVEAGENIRPDNSSWSPKAGVERLGHRTPLTLKTARKISSQDLDTDLGRLLFFGCGAVGSKVVLHLARSGQGSMTLVDEAPLSPHNVVRHGLSSEGVGKNKAQALKASIEGIFYADDGTNVVAVDDSALSVLRGNRKGLLDEHAWLIDATASSALLDAISQAELPEGLSCCRAEIADEGRLGFLSVEGPNRNPRLDDLRASLFDAAIEDEGLSRWLREDRERREQQHGAVLEEISVGLSCSLETMRLSDEDVSLHAAAFSRGFRHAATRDAGLAEGGIQISRLGFGGAPAASVRWCSVPPVTALRAKNDPEWEVRLKGGLERDLLALLEEAAPAETGGLLVGFVSIKTKTVYVTRALPAPPDSVGGAGRFLRGAEGVSEEFTRIAERTGDVLHYVGDWHSHPAGGPGLSRTDQRAANDLRRDLGAVPLPAHLVVATDGGLHPYVFSG